jgi:hypothetical protein
VETTAAFPRRAFTAEDEDDKRGGNRDDEQARLAVAKNIFPGKNEDIYAENWRKKA